MAQEQTIAFSLIVATILCFVAFSGGYFQGREDEREAQKKRLK